MTFLSMGTSVSGGPLVNNAPSQPSAHSSYELCTPGISARVTPLASLTDVVLMVFALYRDIDALGYIKA